MLNVWLARHGEAVDPDEAESDFQRSLTERGRRQIAESTRWLLGREQPPELVLHSPLLRAKQTAETIAEEIGSNLLQIRVENRLAPGIDLDALLSQLARTGAEQIVCVGHQPDMSRCLAEMVGGGHFYYSPGTIAKVVFSGPIVRSGGYLQWIVDPSWFG